MTGDIPPRLLELVRFAQQRVAEYQLNGSRERIAVLLEAADAILMSNADGSVPDTPTETHKAAVQELISYPASQGYSRAEIVSGLIGAADGLALGRVA